jgi:hypothetical protein
MYQLICMSFDGAYVKEFHNFQTIDQAWRYSNDMGSRWYFYPFHFVTTESGLTIADAPRPLGWMIRKRVKSIKKIFKSHSLREEAQGLGVDEYVFNICMG